MLNKSKIFQELQNKLPDIFVNIDQETENAKIIWDYISNKNIDYNTLKNNNIIIPGWLENIANTSNILSQKQAYNIISVDGSQVYPDRHQGISCFLINIGTCQIFYKLEQKSDINLHSEPFLFTNNKIDKLDLAPQTVDCMREELELKTGLLLSKNNKDNNSDIPFLFLFDGSLIFWHLENKEDLKLKFLDNSLKILEDFYKNNLLIAGYISLPKSKDLVNICKAFLLSQEVNNLDKINKNINLDYITDTDIAQIFLKPGSRSILFSCNSQINNLYPNNIKTYFFYMHVYNEIARIEVPEYIAKQPELLNLISQIILDQAQKGYGYPVSLCEAHEQAVIKSSDREFFYNLLCQVTNTNKKNYIYSQKSFKKKVINI